MDGDLSAKKEKKKEKGKERKRKKKSRKKGYKSREKESKGRGGKGVRWRGRVGIRAEKVSKIKNKNERTYEK